MHLWGKLKWVDKFAQLETFTAFRMKNASLTQIELETNQILMTTDLFLLNSNVFTDIKSKSLNSNM
jgi:hypothetical protein